ncbi:MAG: Protein of unknown function (DUF559)/Domain of unknown function [Ilumatobacteraceae bacterium]|nr:Protein of unknown function (DUF559)/Domain of unknown function [Ilumatobacteraceae bacterium]MCU1388540.1 Protein of unknown function (DUF559)/Domain of unknown function [Ilumatobacteraceae bacterium]
MDTRYRCVTEVASTQFGAVSIRQLDEMGVDRSLREKWTRRQVLERLGPRSFGIVGSPPSWHRSAWAAATDAAGAGYLGGRTAARLRGLDGFTGDDIEILVHRSHRGLRTPHRLVSTRLPLGGLDSSVVDGIRCLSAERLILHAPLFDFTTIEIENAIDSALRLRLVSEQRLRTRVVERHRQGINGGRLLLDAMVDTGGESRLERWFLAIVRRGGLVRPDLQKTFRSDGRTVARVDAFFPGGLVVEVAGHGTHSSRLQLQRDEQRRTELTLRGFRVITFTYNDIRDRPDWVIARLREAVALIAS